MQILCLFAKNKIPPVLVNFIYTLRASEHNARLPLYIVLKEQDSLLN